MIIKTPSFELAVYARGDTNASKIALVMPGRLDSKDYSHMVSHVDMLADKGFYAMSFDPPGTWESSGDISDYTMTNYLRAINELIEHFGSKPTLLVGHSRGSTVAILGAINNRYVTGFISIMCPLAPGAYINGIANGWKRKGYQDQYRELPPGDGERSKHYKLPYSFFEDQKKYDLKAGLESLDTPKLFIYGKYDELATPKITKTLYELAKTPKEIYELKSGHKYRQDDKHIDSINDEIDTFIKKHEL